MISKEMLICPYCLEKDGHISGKCIHNYDLKLTSGYAESIDNRDYLSVFILKGKQDKYAGLMIENINGARYINIRYCPFCGRKLYSSNLKREVTNAKD